MFCPALRVTDSTGSRLRLYWSVSLGVRSGREGRGVAVRVAVKVEGKVVGRGEVWRIVGAKGVRVSRALDGGYAKCGCYTVEVSAQLLPGRGSNRPKRTRATRVVPCFTRCATSG